MTHACTNYVNVEHSLILFLHVDTENEIRLGLLDLQIMTGYNSDYLPFYYGRKEFVAWCLNSRIQCLFVSEYK